MSKYHIRASGENLPDLDYSSDEYPSVLDVWGMGYANLDVAGLHPVSLEDLRKKLLSENST